MTKINLAPTTKEELTEKLKHYSLSLGNLNALNVTDHDKISEAITSAFVDTLTAQDPLPKATSHSAPVGYAVVYEEGERMGKKVYDTSGIVGGVFHSVKDAQKKFEEKVKESSTPYFAVPVYPSNMTPLN
ncbi:Hypothetical Protein OBI_RACECAR_47 [Arthrobacter phage Racecar]|nr:hypothetical protein PBI_RACECAR_129 [Arthrobacter phage Racecar]